MSLYPQLYFGAPSISDRFVHTLLLRVTSQRGAAPISQPPAHGSGPTFSGWSITDQALEAAGTAKMDREALLRLAEQASQTIAQHNERIAHQREVVEKLRSGGEPDALSKAQRTLEELMEEQAGSEAALIRIQAKLMFPGPHN